MEENFQHLMIKELAAVILKNIKSYGMPEQRALEASEKILFEICSLLDGNMTLVDNELEYTPQLGFVESSSKQHVLTSNCLHEFATGYYDDLALEHSSEPNIGLNYKIGDVLIGMRARGSINLRDSKTASVVLDEIAAALEPVQKRFRFEIESLAVTPLSKSVLEDLVCNTCGTFDATDPHNVNR